MEACNQYIFDEKKAYCEYAVEIMHSAVLGPRCAAEKNRFVQLETNFSFGPVGLAAKDRRTGVLGDIVRINHNGL